MCFTVDDSTDVLDVYAWRHVETDQDAAVVRETERLRLGSLVEVGGRLKTAFRSAWDKRMYVPVSDHVSPCERSSCE